MSNAIEEVDGRKRLYLTMDVFYLYVSGFMNAIPTLRSFMDDLYETNRIAFYEKAKASPFYNASFMTDRPLDKEVSMRRAFGVLMYAEEDEELQNTICNAIIKYNKSLSVFAKSFSVDQFLEFCRTNEKSCLAANKTNDELNAQIYLAAYICYVKHGIAKKNTLSVKKFHDFIAMDIGERESVDQGGIIQFLNRIGVEEDAETRQLRDLKSIVKSDRGLCALLKAANILDGDDTPATTATNKILKTLSRCSATEREAVVFTTGMCQRLANLFGCNLLMSAQDIQFTEIDIERIYKIVAVSAQCKEAEDRDVVGLDEFTEAIWFAALFKSLRQNREFYFQNNSETQFFALRNLENEVLQLQEQRSEQETAIANANHLIEACKEQINLLSSELAKENKDASKPLLAEITMLRSQIADMQKKLDLEAEKTQELYRLREFVFDMQEGSDIEVEEVSLDNLIEGKRIFVFGGHINWRNRFKQRYPSIEVLDGHNVSFDEAKLIGADMVLLNTSNMSHSLYYKVIDVLRKNHISFDYLGKNSNPNLLENEIYDILTRHKKA